MYKTERSFGVHCNEKNTTPWEVWVIWGENIEKEIDVIYNTEVTIVLVHIVTWKSDMLSERNPNELKSIRN